MTRKKAKIAEQDEVLRHQMLDYLKDVVQALLQPMGDTSKLYVRPPPSLSSDHTRIPPKIFGTSDLTNNLCCSLEAVLIHGLRDSYSSRVTSFFGAPRDKMPCPNFWPVVMTVCHKDDIKEVCNLSYITSDVGRGRAWLRLMINGGQMSSYIDALTRELGVLKDYYKPSALVRQEESCCQLLGTLQPLSTLQFRLATNSSVLNTWTQTPLVLAGMWAPLDGHTVPGWSQPVELAAEMTAAESEEELQRRRREKERAEIFIEETPLNDHLLHAILSATPTTKFIGLEAAVEEESGAASRPKPLVVRTLYPRSEGDVAGALDTCTEETPEPEQPATEELLAAHVPKGDIESIDSSSLLNQSDDGSIVTSSSSLDFNTLLARRLDSVDYCYVNIEHMTLLEGAEQAESPRSVSPTGDEVYNGASKGVGCDDHSTDLTSDAERRRSSLVTQLCPQVGLDEQNYQCHQCRAFIGLFYGQFRVCAMDGHSYCVECHNNYTAVVPARVIFNWDLRQHAVADANRDWLLNCIDDPMIDIRAANPRLYEHVEELDRLRTLRTQLLYLRAYLFTCSSESEAADTLRSMFKSREHFYEHVHLYSVSDLLLVARGGLLFEVQEAVCFSELHVRDCKRCTARGFVCEVCRSNDVIFPFQLHIAQTCPDCCAVYHRSCAPRLTDCPRCVRRRQRRLKERDDFEEENYSALDHLENENLPVEKNDQHDIGEKCDNTLTSKELKSQVQAQEVENFDVSAEPCDVEEDADSIYSGVLHS